MNGPSNAREALIVEALGDVANLLERVETVTAAMESGRLAMTNATAELSGRLRAFDRELTQITQVAKTRVVEHIVKRAVQATDEAVATQVRAMHVAARVAFAEEAYSQLARLGSSVEQLTRRVARPWAFWLTHLATATSTAIATWLLANRPF